MMSMPDNLLITDVQPEPELLPWLEHKESLTQKLIDCKGSADLTVLKETWCMSGWWDRFVLEISPQSIFSREIVIHSQSIPYWYARTVIPETCYHLDIAYFNRLKQESLACLIFDEPKVERVRLVYYPVNSDCMEMYWLPETIALSPNGLIWARLSEFLFMEQARFYLCELLITDALGQMHT